MNNLSSIFNVSFSEVLSYPVLDLPVGNERVAAWGMVAVKAMVIGALAYVGGNFAIEKIRRIVRPRVHVVYAHPVFARLARLRRRGSI